MWGGIPLQDILRAPQRGPCNRSVASSGLSKGRYFFANTAPFESLRERMGAGNQLVFAPTYAGLEGRAEARCLVGELVEPRAMEPKGGTPESP